MKSDDRSGFSNFRMSERSSDLLGAKVGKALFRGLGCPFGILQAPSRYTLCNRVAVNISNYYNCPTLLYIGK